MVVEVFLPQSDGLSQAGQAVCGSLEGGQRNYQTKWNLKVVWDLFQPLASTAAAPNRAPRKGDGWKVYFYRHAKRESFVASFTDWSGCRKAGEDGWKTIATGNGRTSGMEFLFLLLFFAYAKDFKLSSSERSFLGSATQFQWKMRKFLISTHFAGKIPEFGWHFLGWVNCCIFLRCLRLSFASCETRSPFFYVRTHLNTEVKMDTSGRAQGTTVHMVGNLHNMEKTHTHIARTRYL